MPKNDRQDATVHLTGTIARLIRRPNTLMGNPVYTIVLTTGVRLKTRANSGIASEIDNGDYLGVPLIFTISGRGTVTDARTT